MIRGMNNNINIMNKALDGYWLRDKTINQNISNVNTPNYKRLEVNFEDELKTAMKKERSTLATTHGKHIANPSRNVKSGISLGEDYSYRFDNNNVNIDTESAEMAKNTIMYNAVVGQITDEFEKMKNLISEGSK